MSDELVARSNGAGLALAGAKFTRTALQFPDGLDYDGWATAIETLEGIGSSHQWWIGDALNYGEGAYGEKYAQAVDESQAKTWQNYAWVAGRIETSVRTEALGFQHHELVAKFEADEQACWLAYAGQHKLSVRSLRELIRKAHAGRAPELPDGKYAVLYVDPPWRYDGVETPDARQVENHYPTMSLDELKAIEVPAADDAVMFMWATSPKLMEAMELLEAWGFEYRTCMVWVKDRIGMGYYARQQHELLLIARRGDPGVPDESSRPPSVVTCARGAHSAKPHEFYDVIEAMYPDAQRIELFARNTRGDWMPWGNDEALAA